MAGLVPAAAAVKASVTSASASTPRHDNVGALIQQAGWSDAAQQRVRLLYDTLCAGAPSPSSASVCALLEELGVPRAHSEQSVRAIHPFPAQPLSFEAFLLGIVAMDPSTAHAGLWNAARAKFIFRRFDVDGDDRLSIDELAALLSEVSVAYGKPLPPLHEARSEAAQLIAQLQGDDHLTLPQFRDAVGNLKIRGCSRLFRIDAPLFTDGGGVAETAAPSPPAAPGQGGQSIRPEGSRSTSPTRGDNAEVRTISDSMAGLALSQTPLPLPTPPPPTTVDPSSTKDVRFSLKKVVDQSWDSDSPPPPRPAPPPADEADDSADGLPLRKQRSVRICPSDAALLTREVVMGTGRWLEPPSPAPAKEVAKRVRDQLLHSEWRPPLDVDGGGGGLAYLCTERELLDMCRLVVQRRCWCDSSCVHLQTPCKIFGDVHGQFADLKRFFSAYGSPNPYTGDIEYVNYLFLGDYVDRGKHSLEVVALLLALKICHPAQVVLLRGNHEDPQINTNYGFRAECRRRCHDGDMVWAAINTVFEMLPVAAVVGEVVLCLHGGIGDHLTSLEQIRQLPRPVTIDLSTRSVLNDILWSDPTEVDSHLGVHPNQRGPNTVTYGKDRVRRFLEDNGLKLLIRAHQCVQDGFEWCADGQVLTLFSAPDYGAKWTNDAAMLIVNRSLHVFPKVLRSKGRDLAKQHWVNDPERPFTPPRVDEPQSNWAP